jgi:DNA-binding LacI/PurR family transcriptional regulator
MRKNTAIKVRLADIAKEAGVSVVTVAKALNSTGGKNARVSEATADRIKEIAKRLNYRPNILGRSLSNKKSYLIGFVFNINNNLWHHAVQIIGELHKQCLNNGYSLVAYPSSNATEEFKNLQQAIDRQLDGLLTLPSVDLDGSNNAEEYRRIAKEIMPVIQVCYPLCPELPSISHDFRYLARTATEYLQKRNHRKIAIVTFDNFHNKTGGLTSYEHHQGYLEAMNAAGLEPQVFSHGFSPEKHPADISYMIADKIAQSPSRPSAVVVSSNSAALGLIKRWEATGIKVPEDISVIGCASDLDIPACFAPSLTGFVSEFDHIAQDALAMCLGNKVKGKSTHAKIKLKLQQGETVCDFKEPNSK